MSLVGPDPAGSWCCVCGCRSGFERSGWLGEIWPGCLVVDGLVLRYDSAETDDNLPPGEGAFLACSFWLADAYVMLGRMDDARRLFERLLALRNDVGLLAEEYDTASRRQVGNFPQAFSHLALVNTAHNLTRMAKPADQRSESASMATA
jgi:hypothetical protein